MTKDPAAYSAKCARRRRHQRVACLQRAALVLALLALPLLVGLGGR